MKAGGETHGNKNWSTQVNSLDPLEQQWREKLFGATDAAANGGPGAPMSGFYDATMGSAATGMNALGGDPTAVQKLMNPYQQNVVDAMMANWGKTNAATMSQVAADATKARAFGGNRAAIAQGTALANNNLAQNSQIAELLHGGYRDAMTQAATAAGMGFPGATLGMQGAANPDLWRMMMLRGGMLGVPYGTSQGKTDTGFGYSGNFRMGV